MAEEKGQLENKFFQSGIQVAGVDEVGKGCIAGPVFAGCVTLHFSLIEDLSPKDKSLIRDSKTLSTAQRRRSIEIISSIAKEMRVGYASVKEIESYGIQKACFLAMRRAVSQLSTPPDLLLIDGNQTISDWAIPQKPIVKGDQLCFSIAAASIIAKTSRDDLMAKFADKFPHYGFESHVGYGTAAHRSAIESHGICELHRRNFAPINRMIEMKIHPSQ